MLFHRFPCASLAQNCYLIADGDEAAIVDPMRDPDDVLAFAAARGLRVRWALATHVHADFVAGLSEVAAATGARIGLGAAFTGHLPCERLADAAELRLGAVRLRVLDTPGHTAESVSFLVRPEHGAEAPERLLTGDTLFVGDVGRPDLAQGQGTTPRRMAEQLFASLHGPLAALGDATEIWPAHGAGSACGTAIAAATWSTLGAERRGNWARRERDRDAFCTRLLGGLRPPPRYFAGVAAQNRAGPALAATLPAVPELATAAAAAAVRDGAELLDVRSFAEHGRGRWPTARNLGLDGGEFEPWAGELLAAATAIVVHASDGEQAGAAVRRLRRIGCERVVGFVTTLPEQPPTVPQIDAVDVFLPGAGPRWQVIDVRRPEEFAAGHVPGAVHCELAAGMALPAGASLDPAARTAVICEGGYRSSAALAALRALGFTALHNVTDGMCGWRGNHLPQERAPTAASS